ncbi:DUF2752 domain-containing protein [Actinomadura rupiterrae]|uniref:DUF2752 domain-containing protein n=1 Tax=Actinomadura rupiterrae TaxID=559627 RepID=UPI0020A2C15A|nr:DUF2752 domain-containing protein [Actinomadura rupiterrae]MCP2338217.1 hypothetical protein [Actinomadura rupiterrae]
MSQGIPDALGAVGRGTPPVGRRLRGPAAVFGTVAAATVVVTFVDPHTPGHYPTCPFLFLTGYYCPGCGGLRMVNSLTHGHVGTAFGFNPLAFVLLPVLVYLWGRWTYCAVRGERVTTVLLRRGVLAGVVGLLLVYWVVRNLPFAHALAP